MDLQQEVRDLLYRIRLGEDSEIEFKEVRIDGSKIKGLRRDSLADEIAAFANASGGIIVLGVEDQSRAITGIPLDGLDGVEDFVREVCINSIVPEVPAHVLRLELPDKAGQQQPVIRLRIPKSLFVHRSPGGYYRRIGSAKREMAPDVLARLFQQRSQAGLIRFDEQAVPDSDLDDADAALCERFLRAGSEPEQSLLRKLNLLRRDESGSLRLSVAGALLITERPAAWLPGAYIQCVAYSGKMRYADDQIDAQDCEGPLDQQISAAFHFVGKNMRVEAIKDPGRIDIPQFSDAAVYEAIVNAVAHRDYAATGARVRVHLFQDRLEIASPGPLTNSMSVETLDKTTATRNETLTNLLGRYYEADPITNRRNIIERRGEGVPIILGESEKLSGRKPEYELIDEQELKLTLWAADKESYKQRHGL